MLSRGVAVRWLNSVLLISQYPEDHEFFRRTSTQAGWQVESISAWHGAAPALQQGRFRVVISEAALPDGSWLDVLGFLQSLGNPPLLVVISRSADERLWADVLNRGGFDVLAKPLACDEAVRVIGCALDHQAGEAREPLW